MNVGTKVVSALPGLRFLGPLGVRHVRDSGVKVGAKVVRPLPGLPFLGPKTGQCVSRLAHLYHRLLFVDTGTDHPSFLPQRSMCYAMNPRLRRSRMKRAFTLIELLIVVAIIAILAAIAVPNFLEAQTRAKVTRVKAEMRGHATALESYRVDYNRYPFPDDVQGGRLSAADAPRTFFETKFPVSLTTPIAYLTQLSSDQFRNLAEKSEVYLPYHYSDRIYAERFSTEAGTPEYDALVFAMSGRVNRSVGWYFLSHGPDNDHDAGPSNGGTPGLPGHISGDGVAPYDPTNGTLSNGDLIMLGPGVGFP